MVSQDFGANFPECDIEKVRKKAEQSALAFGPPVKPKWLKGEASRAWE